MDAEPSLQLRSSRGRWTLLATVMASGMAFIDGSVVNVAVPRIGRDFHVGLADLQWTITGYTLTLSAFLLLGGALGDRHGRRRIFAIGIAWFTAASVVCAVAPNALTLIVARVVQGAGSALLTPGSLSIIEASFRKEDRGAAIGAWSGFGALFGAVGPLLGGVMVQFASWRLAFVINVPLGLIALAVTLRHVPESQSRGERGRLDLPGPALAALGLGGLTYALIEGPAGGWTPPNLLAFGLGALCLAAFLLVEWRLPHPLMPLGIFRSRPFSGTNAATFAIYGALGAVLFLLVLQLQDGLGYPPVLAGVALLPSILLLLFASWSGRLAARIGPRLPMTAGPLLAACGMALLMRVTPGATYAEAVLPGVLIFGYGLVLTVPALTTTALGALSSDQAGLASAVNNDVARAAGLIAVAVIPALAGIPTGGSVVHAALLAQRFPAGMLICAVLCAAGGMISFLTVPGRAEPPGMSRGAATFDGVTEERVAAGVVPTGSG